MVLARSQLENMDKDEFLEQLLKCKFIGCVVKTC